MKVLYVNVFDGMVSAKQISMEEANLLYSATYPGNELDWKINPDEVLYLDDGFQCLILGAQLEIVSC